MRISRYIANKVAFSSSSAFTKWILRLAITSVALSLTVMIIAFSMISGFKKDISNKIFGFWGHIHITDGNYSRSMEAVPMKRNQDFLYDLDTLEHIMYQKPISILGNPIPGKYRQKILDVDIRSVYAVAITPAIINSKEELDGVMVRGLGSDYDWSIFEQYLVEGRPIEYQDEEASNEVLVSETIAKRLKLEVGSPLVINIIKNGLEIKRRVSIVGIYKIGIEEYDRKMIIADLKKVQDLLDWTENEVAGYEIIFENTENLSTINEYIYTDILPSRLYSETIRDKFPNIFEWLDLQDMNGVVILTLMLLVAIINMITSVIILIIERSKMIGTLKALGMKNWSIRRIFLYYGGYIILYGLLLGNVLGIGLCLLQKYTGIVKLDEENYYLSVAPINVVPSDIILLNIGAFILILIFLLLPTIIISRLDPVKILRFD